MVFVFDLVLTVQKLIGKSENVLSVSRILRKLCTAVVNKISNHEIEWEYNNIEVEFWFHLAYDRRSAIRGPKI